MATSIARLREEARRRALAVYGESAAYDDDDDEHDDGVLNVYMNNGGSGFVGMGGPDGSHYYSTASMGFSSEAERGSRGHASTGWGAATAGTNQNPSRSGGGSGSVSASSTAFAAMRQDQHPYLSRHQPSHRPNQSGGRDPGINAGSYQQQHQQQQRPRGATNDITAGGAPAGGLAKSARREWRNHGVGLTQALEEKRYAASAGVSASPLPSQRFSFVVRVISAQRRVDLSGASYTAYVVHVILNRQNRPGARHENAGASISSSTVLVEDEADYSSSTVESIVEHRYSDFVKLNNLIRRHRVDLDAAFPSKHWAGRIGNWTPALAWAPEHHDELISYRIVQLDAWLVHLVEKYNQQQHLLPEPVSTAVYDFFMTPSVPPCERINEMDCENRWKWNNPFAFTLGSSIRQATQTVEYMCRINTGSHLERSDGVGRRINVLSESDQNIPVDLLLSAKGLCFMTVCKAGLVVSGRVGTGLLIARVGDYWSAPCAVGTVGMGWGALVGGDVTHYLIVLTTDKAVRDLVSSSSSVQLGAELGVAVGPVGRGANSHLQTGDWTLHPAYAYAHSQGFFAGISLEGSVVTVRNDVNAKFYGQPGIRAQDLLKQVPGPKAAEPLYQALLRSTQVEIRDGAFRPSQLWSNQTKPMSPVSNNTVYYPGRGAPSAPSLATAGPAFP